MLSLTAVKRGVLSKPLGPFAFRMKRHPALSPAEQIDLLGTDVAFARNVQFYGEGESATYFYKIVSGVARNFRMAADGRRQIVAFYVPGDLFGFEVGNTHTLSAEAIADTRVRMIKRTAIIELAAQDEEVAHHLWLSLSREIRRDQEHILQFGRPARERVASFLLEMAQRIPTADAEALSISRQDIADYLDLRIETISRTMTQFAKLGAIALSGNRKITIRDQAVLNQMIG
jgi:CRP/FNR family transcriptional regulator, nitrogen fixation regulation protein